MKKVLLCLLLACPVPVFAQSPRTDDPTVGAGYRRGAAAPMIVEAVAVRDATALKIDGVLTDEVWSRAPKIDGFVQREPKEGAAATYPTEARVAYDAEHLYVAILAHDPEPDKI